MTKPGFPQKWIFHPNPDVRSVGIACCDIVNRGASFADGKIIYNTLDDQPLLLTQERAEGMGDRRRRHKIRRDDHHGARRCPQHGVRRH